MPKRISKLDRLDDRDNFVKIFFFHGLCKYRAGLKPLAKKYGIAENIGYGMALEMFSLLCFGIRGTRSARRGLMLLKKLGKPSEIKSATGTKAIISAPNIHLEITNLEIMSQKIKV